MAEKLGFIGLGVMGGRMSRRLLAAGFPLVVFDTNSDAAAPLLALGAEAAHSPAEMARECGKVITMLPNSAAVEQVSLGADGLAEGLRPGSTLIDMTSGDPDATRRIASALGRRSMHMIDAPVIGSFSAAAEGALTIVAAGDENVYRACSPILQVLGNKLYHVGPLGTGHTLKAINNMLFAINMLGVCEALVLGVKAGIEPEKIVEIVGGGTVGTAPLNVKVPRFILANDFRPGFTADLMYKDLDTATTLGRRLGVPLLAGSLVQQVLGMARGKGMGGLDHSCIVKLVEESAGIRVRPE